MPGLNSGREAVYELSGCYSCFTKCSLVKGKCFAGSEDIKQSCDIWKNRQTDPAFYYGAHWHGIHPLAFNIRTAILFIQDMKEKEEPEEKKINYIEKYIPNIASYTKYYRKELGQCPAPAFDIDRLSKITSYYTGKKLSGFCLPEYPAEYINGQMSVYKAHIKNEPQYYGGRKYKTTMLEA